MRKDTFKCIQLLRIMLNFIKNLLVSALYTKMVPLLYTKNIRIIHFGRDKQMSWCSFSSQDIMRTIWLDRRLQTSRRRKSFDNPNDCDYSACSLSAFFRCQLRNELAMLGVYTMVREYMTTYLYILECIYTCMYIIIGDWQLASGFAWQAPSSSREEVNQHETRFIRLLK